MSEIKKIWEIGVSVMGVKKRARKPDWHRFEITETPDLGCEVNPYVWAEECRKVVRSKMKSWERVYIECWPVTIEEIPTADGKDVIRIRQLKIALNGGGRTQRAVLEFQP